VTNAHAQFTCNAFRHGRGRVEYEMVVQALQFTVEFALRETRWKELSARQTQVLGR
jgi:hypothetical protein